MTAPATPSSPALHVVAGPHLSAAQLHALLRLRMDVFVVEQACPYPDIDGRDLEPGTEHVWLADREGVVLASARILDLPSASAAPRPTVVIGRVVTRPDRRGEGLARAVLQAALDRVDGHRADGFEVRIGAQAHLERWYEQFGFRRSGSDYLEDGIPHLPMRRP